MDAFHPFRVQDAALFSGACHLALTEQDAILLTTMSCTLTFTTQKNQVQGETIGHGHSTALTACPMRVLARLLIAARQARAPPNMPLCAYFYQDRWVMLQAMQLTAAIHLQVAIRGAAYNLSPADVSTCSLRASGAMALLLAGIDADRIKLVGRWRSDEMFRYLHAQAEPVMRLFARSMLLGGQYSLLPAPPGPPARP